jgi:hypothetical protein
VPSERIEERASRVAAHVSAGALVIGVCALGLALSNAWSLLEGFDVLFAPRGVAPASIQWLDDIELTARPPEYLHESEIRETALTPLVLPNGTLLTLRGSPLHPGRKLALSDGRTEVPFVEDGASALVARWALTETVTLRVVVRFGDVVVREPTELAIAVIQDAAPVVKLDGAPRPVSLVDQTEDIPIKYEATDDHGLREVHLVLRSGAREERRVLARLDGETTSDKGGHTLRLRDPFLTKSHAPVDVTVEAKDNDPLTGPKWGGSAAITVIPPDVGGPEAQRLDALRRLRDGLVDTLAWRLRSDLPQDAAARRTFLADEDSRARMDEALLDHTHSTVYAGVRIPPGIRAMLTARQQATRKALDAELRSPSAATRAAVVKATERFVLVADAIVRGLGLRDARESARQLAEVADDLAVGAGQMQSEATDTRARGAARADAAHVVLSSGGRAMQRLGALGRDLGEIVDADLGRVRRAREGKDLIHAELAARDLAARLHQPDPSFGARGGSIGRGGDEAGGTGGTPGDDAESDEVAQAFHEAAQDLERLSRDHAGEVSKTEEALAGAASDEEQTRLREEAKRHAEAVRAAARELPTVGMGSQSWTSKGAAGRELAEQMAQSLEQGRPEAAVESGRGALGALDGAKEMLRKGGWLAGGGGDAQMRVEEARRKLDGEQKWAEEQLRRMRRQAAEHARPQLEQGGQEEDKLADRARGLEQKARERGSLPEQVVESIGAAERAARQAAQALKQGDADRGLELEREAQRDLEAAREQLRAGEDDSGSSTEDNGDGREPSHDPFVWKHEFKGPEAFRRRVMRGLAQPASGSLRDAVQRYAEGLLR